LLLWLPAAAQESSRATSAQGASKYKIDIDYTATPELKDWVEKELRPAVELWYPIIVADLPSEGYTPPQHFDIKIDPGYNGIAATAGTHVMVSPTWIKSQSARGPVNESVGSVIHELVHVVQQYGRAGRRNPMPGWLTEGIADYIRWWKYEPASVRRPVRPVKRNGDAASYKDSYQTTAAFLEFVAKNYDHELCVKLNAAGRDGNYSPELWKQFTGKSADELWNEFVLTLKK
jgi:hypothetical protein